MSKKAAFLALMKANPGVWFSKNEIKAATGLDAVSQRAGQLIREGHKVERSTRQVGPKTVVGVYRVVSI